jgi:hypothetical protein
VSAQARSTPERQVHLAWRGGDEILENIRHRHWRLGVREVSDTLEHLEATACPRVVGGYACQTGMIRSRSPQIRRVVDRPSGEACSAR